tara:strand:- start:1601 stop:1876 length:276 start_codon:yes stop_codon:yes gene_type:complete
MRTRFETAADIFSLMYDANLADSDISADWQSPAMASDLYYDLYKAAEKVLGESFLHELSEGDGTCLDAEGIHDAWDNLPEVYKDKFSKEWK